MQLSPYAYPKLPIGAEEAFCDAGVRTGYCGPFSRVPQQEDAPLWLQVFKRRNQKAKVQVKYAVLSGPETSEAFPGQPVWGRIDPRCSTHQIPIRDQNGDIIGYEEERVCVNVQYASEIVWEIPATWFDSRVETRSVIFSVGNQDIELTGPGIDGAQHLNVGQTRGGNNAHPSGQWSATLLREPLMRDAEEDPLYVPDFRLSFVLACLDN